MCGILDQQWGAWSTWSTCSYKCTGNDADRGRSQSRTRQVMSNNKVTNTETEQRPCNAVEYAGNEFCRILHLNVALHKKATQPHVLVGDLEVNHFKV